ncbi:copper chaperone PCu(A)C [Salinarimonas sp. NSM]|uniref:copper chaperone PCu(A)C n=1 Tax=Salinarimonas sp. NSM TaxID=3458003 RepID=UPI004035B853
MLATLTRAARAAALALGLAGIPLLPASAETFGAGDIRIETPWSRATPGAAPVAGGYLTIVNTGSEPDRLLGGSVEIAERFEVHSMETVDGIARMAPVEGGLEIPAGESVALAPGGYHVMFMGLKRPLAEGEAFEATLVFERAGEVPVTFSVGGMGSRTPPMGHGAH